jgi:hypothetical protein
MNSTGLTSVYNAIEVDIPLFNDATKKDSINGRDVAKELMVCDLHKNGKMEETNLYSLFAHTELILNAAGRTLQGSEEDSHTFWLDLAGEILTKAKVEKDAEVESNKRSSVGAKTEKTNKYRMLQNALREFGVCKIVVRVINSIAAYIDESNTNIIKNIHKHAIIVGVFLLEDANEETQVVFQFNSRYLFMISYDI